MGGEGLFYYPYIRCDKGQSRVTLESINCQPKSVHLDLDDSTSGGFKFCGKVLGFGIFLLLLHSISK